MSQKSLTGMLYTVISIVLLFIVAVYAWFIPEFARSLRDCYNEFSEYYVPALIFVELTALPLIIAALCAIVITHEISKDNSFSRINAKIMKIISFLALGDAVYFQVGIIIFANSGVGSGPCMILSFIITIIGLIISACAGALSHLILKAALIREENEMTI